MAVPNPQNHNNSRQHPEEKVMVHLKALFEDAVEQQKAMGLSLDFKNKASIKDGGQDIQQHQYQTQEPKINPDDLRRELFKMYYAT